MSQEIQFILYNLPEENGKVQVIIRDETLWCTQKAMAQLFGVDRTVVSKHLKNIFESSELQQDSVCAKFAHTAEDGKIYNTQFYNLDAVISVGYRVNSLQATRFRQWATKIRCRRVLVIVDTTLCIYIGDLLPDTSFTGTDRTYPFKQFTEIVFSEYCRSLL